MASALIAGAIALASHGPAARAQQPVFRAGIDLLTIDVTAIDGDEQPVRDLRPEEFTVMIGGKARKVVAARFYGASPAPPAEPGAPAPIADVLRPADAPGRTVVFVVDRDSLKPGNEQAMLRATSVVFDGLSPADAVGLIGVPVGGIDLTREHARVRAALPMMTGTRPRPVAVGRERSISWDEAVAFERLDRRIMAEVIERECYLLPAGQRNSCPDDLAIQAREFLSTGRAQARGTLSKLGMLADQLAAVRGPKHVILLSGGLGWDQDLLADFNQFARRATAAQIVIHAIHLDQPDADTTDRMRVTSAFGGQTMTTGLGNLTSMTGGTMFMGVGRATGAFERIRDQISNFYQLAVESGPEDVPGANRDLKIAVARPNVSLRARREIPVAAAPRSTATPPDPLAALFQQPTDLNEVPVAVTTYTTRGSDESRLRVLISGEVGTGPAVPASDFGFVVLRDGNVVATGRQHLEAAAGPQIVTMAALLLPGPYRLRYAAATGDGRAGSADVPLTVGLRAAGEFQISDLMVGVAEAGRLQTRSRIPLGAQMAALMELMSPDPARLEAARVTLEVIPAGTAQPVLRLLMAAKGNESGTLVLHQASVDTTRLAPGRYTLIATPIVAETPLGRVSRLIQIDGK